METQERCRVCYDYIFSPKQARAKQEYCVHEGERIVLGCMLWERNLTKKAIDILKTDDFDIQENRIVYKAILELFKKRTLFEQQGTVFSDWTVPVVNVNLLLEEKRTKIPREYIMSLAIAWIPGALFLPDSPVLPSDVLSYFAYGVKRYAIIRHFREVSDTNMTDRLKDYLCPIETKIKQTQTYKMMLKERSGKN
ncbi:hypothetical protein ES702_07553 [subsurface metagenome]